MTIKFGGKQTMAEKVAVASKYKSDPVKKSKTPSRAPKVSPIIGKDKIGIKAKWKV